MVLDLRQGKAPERRVAADLLLVVSASPWEQRKIRLREEMLADAARRHRLPVVFCNLVGGNDELIFDGASFVIDGAGRTVRRLARFEEDLLIAGPEGSGSADRS